MGLRSIMSRTVWSNWVLASGGMVILNNDSPRHDEADLVPLTG
jgi:hypothetical protein